ncbi:MAG TPA: protein kinase [Thermoanaerobaculia bacterium]
MMLSPDESVGAYTILGPLGRGGMGEVYRARDSRLGREVALKILPEEAAGDPERSRRFEQEARSASALNHPNIVVIYETGEATPQGRALPVRFIAMELLDGESLESLLAGGGLPLKRVLQYAGQIADGLARAHEAGIVHRDLKPANIVATRDGHLKILDFGLAKLRPLPGEDKTYEVTTDPTLTSPGTLLGTIGYMAPEQVRGEPATPASDQFALGCILYEMLTGQRPFQRRSTAETLSAIMRDEPPAIEERNPDVPVPIRWIVERCLSKSAHDRYASTRDLARDLQKLRETATESSLRSMSIKFQSPRRRRALRLAALGLFIAAAAAGGSYLLFEKLQAVAPPIFQRLTFRHGMVWRGLFVPNGSSVFYTATWEDQPTATYLTSPESAGLDRKLDAEALLPMAFSPDGSEALVLLGTFRLPNGLLSGTLARMPALGGRPRPILAEAAWADWSRSGELLAAVRNAGGERVLELRDAEGGNAKELFRTRGSISSVRFSPDDAWIAFIHHPDVQATTGEVQIAAREGGARRVLTGLQPSLGLDWNDRTGEVWFTTTESGHGVLKAVRPSGRLRVIDSFPDQFILQSIQPGSGRALFTSAKLRGALIVFKNGQPRDMSWLDYTRVTDVSPDGKTVLFFDRGPTTKTWGTWIRPIDGGEAVRLGSWEPGRFSPDARRIVGISQDAEDNGQLVLFPVGAGDSQPLPTPNLSAEEPTFAGPDRILFVGTREGKPQVWTIRTDGSELRALGAPDCALPRPSPSLQSFVCEGGPALFVYPMEGGPGRKIFEHPAGKRLWYARFDSSGERLFAVGADRKFFTLDATSGRVLREETLPVPKSLGYAELIDASVDPEGSIVVYSLNVYSSQMYSVSGLR